MANLSDAAIQITVNSAAFTDGTVVPPTTPIEVRLWLANSGSTIVVTQPIPGLQVGGPPVWSLLSQLPPERSGPQKRISDALQDANVTVIPAGPNQGRFYLLSLFIQAGKWDGTLTPSSLTLSPTGELGSLSVTVQLALQTDGGPGPTAGPWLEQVSGSAVLLLLRGFGYGQKAADWFAAVQSMAVRAKQYLTLAQQAAQAANPPGCGDQLLKLLLGLFDIQLAPPGVSGPRRFPVTAVNMVGGQGSVPQLTSMSQALGLLGLNTGLPITWDRIPTDVRDKTQTAAGLTWRAWGQAAINLLFVGSDIGGLFPFDFGLKSLDDGDVPKTVPPGSTQTHWTNQPTRDSWAKDFVTQAQNETGGTPDRLAICQVEDDWGWSFVSPGPTLPTPVATDAVRNYMAPAGRKQPQPWLNTFDPGDPGSDTFPEDPGNPVLGWRGFLKKATGFDGQPLPIANMDQADLSDLPDPTKPNFGDLTGWSSDQRVRYLWTMRFFARAGALGLKRAIWALLQQGVPPSILVYGHMRNQGGLLLDPWQTGSTSHHWADWFEIGRQGGLALWIEPILETIDGQTLADHPQSDSASQYSSYSANLAHSAANCAKAGIAPPDAPFGGMLTQFGDHPAGVAYRVFSMVGHGAKGVELYWCGPSFIAGTIGSMWIDDDLLDNPGGSTALAQVYQSVADAMQLLGVSEDILYPGVRNRAKIALLQPLCSWYWDDYPAPRLYQAELAGLQFALAHSQYSVDFIDARGIVDGHLDDYGYSVLYVTEPNIPVAVLNKISDWIQAGQGRVLVAMPGAGSLDEYNSPAIHTTTRFEEALGLDPTVNRDPGYPRPALRPDPGIVAPTTVTLTPWFQTGGASVVVKGPTRPLKSPLTPLATDSAGNCLATSKTWVNSSDQSVGQAVALGFFPGWAYWLTATWGKPGSLPQGWGDTERILARLGATLAAVPRVAAATSRLADGQAEVNGVEVCRLDAPRGIGLVLLNWTGTPFRSLTLTVPQVGPFIRASSAQGSSIAATANQDGSLTLTLPLQYVDVVLLRPSRRPPPPQTE